LTIEEPTNFSFPYSKKICKSANLQICQSANLPN